MPEVKSYPEALQRIIAYFSHLPGIGGRTAERLALSLMSWRESDLDGFGGQIASLKKDVGFCPVCGYLTNGGELCRFCRSEERERSIICVVEQVTQVHTIESSGSFKGLYHVLGGKISPMKGRGPSDLRIAELRERLEGGDVKELLIALSPDVEGEATAHYLAQEFSGMGVSLSRIAAGVPVGTDLSFADAATLASAIAGRRMFGVQADDGRN